MYRKMVFGKNYRKLEDSELLSIVQNKQNGQDKAFAELYRRYAPKVHAYLSVMMRYSEQVEDVFQEVFIRFYQSAKESLDATNLQAYLLKIARNLAYNVTRDKKVMVPIEDYDYLFQTHNTYEKSEMLEMVMNSIDTLNVDLKEAFTLREIDGLDYKQISEILNITEVYARKKVMLARAKLKEILTPYL